MAESWNTKHTNQERKAAQHLDRRLVVCCNLNVGTQLDNVVAELDDIDSADIHCLTIGTIVSE